MLSTLLFGTLFSEEEAGESGLPADDSGGSQYTTIDEAIKTQSIRKSSILYHAHGGAKKCRNATKAESYNL